MTKNSNGEKPLGIGLDIVGYAKSAYDSGHPIEAVTILHAAIEFIMNAVLRIYFSKLVKNLKIAYFDYKTVARILFGLGLISVNEFGDLRKFNTERNRLVHNLFKEYVREKHAKTAYELGDRMLLMIANRGAKLGQSQTLKEIERDVSSKLTSLLASLGDKN
jgi:hypothetical protein